MERSQPSDEEIAQAIRQLDESQAESVPSPSDASAPLDRREEYRSVLDLIDQLGRELKPRSDGAPESGLRSTSEAYPEGTTAAEEAASDLPTESSPYLEERLAVASGSIVSLGQEVRVMGEHWQRLQGTVELLERELGMAAREVAFLSSADGTPPAPLPIPVEVPRSSPAPTPVAVRAPSPTSTPPTPAYLGFTAARYNATVDGLKGRRRRLALWTAVLAAIISAALVALALWAHEPTPPLWLAVLPVLWMVPVPFFVLSFFGTQRVLRRNHLNVAGDP
jgi:hypothetical protein